jgi:HEPN domain-containing protein
MDKVQHWLNIAEEDVSVAEVLLKGGKFLQAGFFCHLIVEKSLKAIVQKNTGETPPKIHKLLVLAVKGEIHDSLTEEQLALLEELDPLQMEARYPEYKAKIAKTLTKEKAERIFKQAEEFLCWTKKKLGK